MELASSCEGARTPREKIEECTRVIAAAPQLEANPASIEKILAAVYLERAMAHFSQGSLEAADSDLQIVVRKDPNSFAAYHNLGQIKLARQDWLGALAEFDLALATAPTDPTPAIKKNIAKIYISRRYAFEQLGEMTQALDAAGKALAIAPRDATANNNMGYLYLRTGEYDRSLLYYVRAVALDPTDSKARAGLMEVRRRLLTEN